MEYKTEFTILLPEKLTAALDIDEDTLFETYFDDGKIKVRVIDESEFEDELSNCDLTDNGKECAECPNYAEKYKGKYSVLQVGTGDSPLTVPFYEKCGFVKTHSIKNFFIDNYDHPIYECGVRLTDMIYLQRAI